MELSSHQRYALPAILLHWVMAVGLLGAMGFGLYMTELPFSPTRLKLYNWHKWVGIALLGLSVLRVVWRLTHRPPADLPMPAWQARLAHLTHGAMYGLFLAVPLVGWARSSAAGFPVVWLGVLPLPDWVPRNEALAHTLKEAHELLAYTLLILIALHVAAALQHAWVARDALLQRMLPQRR
ncbi:cytochrome b [Roseateles sp. BYS180W]|uniref:Cytochrome b n=1 Tax=Roseateles rivi TaxID=3299028 RepID=A0ABW7FWP1_9BURK